MKISIAMTTYNGDKYLRFQLDSLLSQTVSDFELIICDDNSSDKTWTILSEYEKKDKRVKIFRNEQNLGFIKNFEKAVSLCTGDYIALSDQDDIWKENHLEILMNSLNGATASFGNAVIMNAQNQICTDLLSGRDRYFVDGTNEDKLTRILFYGNPFQGTSSLYERQIFSYAFPIPAGIEYHDAWFAAVACCLHGLNYTYEVITNYRIHGNNASGSHKWNFFRQIISSLKRSGWKTDRIIFCEELKKRIPTMKEEIKTVIKQACVFHKERLEGKRIKTIFRVIKNYKKIYSMSSHKYMISRCLGILFRG